MHPFKQTLHSYHQLLARPDSDLESKCELASPATEVQRPYSRLRDRIQSLAHLALTAVLAVSLAVSLACGHDRFPTAYRTYGTYEHGFKTDLHSLKPTISLVNKKFYGGVHLDPNGTYWLSKDPDAPSFVGEPSLEVDQAWEHELLRKRYYGLTTEETEEQFSKEFVAEFASIRPWKWYAAVGMPTTIEDGVDCFEPGCATRIEDMKAVSNSSVWAGEHDVLFVTREYHLWHCAYMWRKLHRAIRRGGPVDGYVDSLVHTEHCSMMLAMKDSSSDVDTIIAVKFRLGERRRRYWKATGFADTARYGGLSLLLVPSHLVRLF